MPDCLLASRSPRRREILSQIGVDFAVVSVDVEEVRRGGESAADYVQRLSREKALAGQQGEAGQLPVIGADTIVVLADEVLEKPADEAHCLAMLKALSGRTHEVMTAVSVCQGERCETRLSVTEVHFRSLHADEASAYWQSGEPADKAGAYGIQGLGAVFVEHISGSYTGVVGLPIEITVPLLARFGVRCWRKLESRSS